MNVPESILAAHPFARTLGPRFIPLLAGCASGVRFEAMQQIFREGEEADRCYLIRSGQVALQTYIPNRGLVTIETIGAGSVLGWSWLVPPYRWHFGAIAIEPTETTALAADRLREKMEENHDFGYEVLNSMNRVILERLQATRTRLLGLYDAPR